MLALGIVLGMAVGVFWVYAFSVVAEWLHNRRWRERAEEVERASFHCAGEERDKRVLP